MSYEIVAKPTKYRGTLFRSRLEAKWAAFFDIIGWEWIYEPIDFKDWTPDFSVEFHCGHSECDGAHSFYAEVKPYDSVEAFKGHPAARNCWGSPYGKDGSLLLGVSPIVSGTTDFAHGAGGGSYGAEVFTNWEMRLSSKYPRISVEAHDELTLPNDTTEYLEYLWSEAGNLTQWHP
jgi:hypothetical protein